MAAVVRGEPVKADTDLRRFENSNQLVIGC
jgi:hypothetical protein